MTEPIPGLIEAVMETVREPLLILDLDLRVKMVNFVSDVIHISDPVQGYQRSRAMLMRS